MMVADKNLLTYVCSELAAELASQPSWRFKSSLTSNEIECAANSLGWDTTYLTPMRASDPSESTQLSRSHIQDIWVKPFPVCQKSDVIVPQIYMYQQQDWRPTGINDDESSQPAGSTAVRGIIEGPPILPDGIREFIRQVEHLYDQDDEKAVKTQREILESLASSEHMPICFPHLVKYAVDKIRTSYRKYGEIVLKLIDLLEHILRNPYFDLTESISSGVFELLIGCFVMLITDVNLLSICDEAPPIHISAQIRQKSVELLRTLLELKIGKFHSVALIDDLMDVHLIPLISVIQKRLKNPQISIDVRNRLEQVLNSTNLLMKELVHVNQSRLATSSRRSYVG